MTEGKTGYRERKVIREGNVTADLLLSMPAGEYPAGVSRFLRDMGRAAGDFLLRFARARAKKYPGEAERMSLSVTVTARTDGDTLVFCRQARLVFHGRVARTERVFSFDGRTGKIRLPKSGRAGHLSRVKKPRFFASRGKTGK